MADSVVIRRAELSERGLVLDTLARAFGRPEGPRPDFTGRFPYLFTDERARDHWLCLAQGEPAGVAGAYPFDLRHDGVSFRGVAVGQVGTVPEHRGKGVMSALLGAVNRWTVENGFDLSWLGGDRMRYRRFGWIYGGRTMRFTFTKRTLPEPPPAGNLRGLDVAVDL